MARAAAELQELRYQLEIDLQDRVFCRDCLGDDRSSRLINMLLTVAAMLLVISDLDGGRLAE